MAWAPERVLAQASAPPFPKLDMVDVVLEGAGLDTPPSQTDRSVRGGAPSMSQSSSSSRSMA